MSFRLHPIYMGWISSVAAGAALNTNAAVSRIALVFIANKAEALNAVRANGVLTGTLTAANLTAALYTTTASTGKPLALLETVNCSTVPASGWLEWNGFTTVLTAGVQYAIVFANGHATPASNHFAFHVYTSVTSPTCSRSPYLWGTTTSTDSGATWATLTANQHALQVKYSGGTWDGITGSGTSITALAAAYGSVETGVLFTSPEVPVITTGGRFYLQTNLGTPTVGLVYKLYEGTTLKATSWSMPLGMITNDQTIGLGWTPYTMQPNTQHRLVACQPSGGDASNCYRLQQITRDSAANSLLMPFGAQKTVWNGASWIDTPTASFQWILFLDAAVGASMIRHPGMNGGMNG